MKDKILTTLLGLAIVVVPAVAPASQPAVKLAGVRADMDLTLSAADLGLLLADPSETAELSIVLPSGFTTLEAIDGDPFQR